MVDITFWNNKKVFITGHTGFKGSWLSLWLSSMGAAVTGYALSPPTDPNLFDLAKINKKIKSIMGDLRDKELLQMAVDDAQPEIIFHLAAQALVRESYKDPITTYSTNVMGLVNLFESIRNCPSVKAVVNITTDKCYENKEWVWGYRENERLGGFDPYSNSKACSELVTECYRNSFFNPDVYDTHGIAIATARAGNVIGGGDWASDRLIPDFIRSIIAQKEIHIRSPRAIRPWQHVLEPLSGYILLAQQLYKYGIEFGEAYNFGPDDIDAKPVEWIIEKLCEKWNDAIPYCIDQTQQLHEANYLKLDHSKASFKLGWYPRWKLEDALDKIVEWLQVYLQGGNIDEICLKQIVEYGSLPWGDKKY